jgi:DNA polymerase III sliding clamp (beta) subunit (PCNA family)
VKLIRNRGSFSKLDISSQSAGWGEAGETIPIRYAGKKITAGFNASYLSDIFNALDENEILLEIRNGETPA